MTRIVLIFIMLAIHSPALLQGSPFLDSTKAMIILKDGQTANINLLDTTGSKIVYIRFNNKVLLEKSVVQSIVINGDTIDYSHFQPPLRTMPDFVQAGSTTPINVEKPEGICPTEYYSNKAPALIEQSLASGHLGNILTFLGIGSQVLVITNAQDIGLVPSLIILTGGAIANIAGPQIAMRNYFKASDIVEQAYGCDMRAATTFSGYSSSNRIATGLFLAGSIAAILPPRVPIATWESSDGRSRSELSLSPIGLLLSSIADLIYIINIEQAAGYACSIQRKCGQKKISIVPSYDVIQGPGLRIVVNL